MDAEARRAILEKYRSLYAPSPQEKLPATPTAEGVIYLADIKEGDTVFIHTLTSFYRLVRKPTSLVMDGHHDYCSKPTNVLIHGAMVGNNLVKTLICLNAYIEFFTKERGKLLTAEVKTMWHYRGEVLLRKLE